MQALALGIVLIESDQLNAKSCTGWRTVRQSLEKTGLGIWTGRVWPRL